MDLQVQPFTYPDSERQTMEIWLNDHIVDTIILEQGFRTYRVVLPAEFLNPDVNTIQFLYGSVAADISFAKKYVPEGRHSHHWRVGEEILKAAPDEPLKAAAYGYLGHLAADTLAHNTYVPRKLFLTRTGKSDLDSISIVMIKKR